MLAQLSTVKTRCGITASTDDAVLTNFIELATGVFNRHCNRTFARSATATDEFAADHCELNLSRPPLETVSTWELLTSQADGWVTQTGVDYVPRTTPGGCILSLAEPLGTYRQRVRVTYAGGYVLPGTSPTGSQVALPDEIEHACVEQVVCWYQNRTKLGLQSAGEAIVFADNRQLALLPQVRAALASHVRWNP